MSVDQQLFLGKTHFRLLGFQRGQNLVEEGFVLSLVGLLELQLAAEDNLAGLSHAERHLDGGNLHILTIDIVVFFTLLAEGD